MLGNGDERQQAAWERVEAKLDRLAEIVGDVAGVQTEHGRTLTLLDRRLSRVEGDLDMVKLMIDSVRHDIERRAERLKDELLTSFSFGRETTLGARTVPRTGPNDFSREFNQP
ncbi:MAG: hypothetical protein U1E45_23430 [Geminicoccaceae bacterium]